MECTLDCRLRQTCKDFSRYHFILSSQRESSVYHLAAILYLNYLGGLL